MKTKILNYGSLNIDEVYRVPHFVRPGETLSSLSLSTYAGGKGANQSVALARAGAQVFHAGKIGTDGKWLKLKLDQNNVNTQYILDGTLKNGHAIIQVTPEGENSIILYSGANQEIELEEIENVLSKFDHGDFLLLQNEINHIPELITHGHSQELKVIFNPAPMTPEVKKYPLTLCDTLIINEIEGEMLTAQKQPQEILDALTEKLFDTAIILTLGSKGVYYQKGKEQVFHPAEKGPVVDTTAAGDTFIGYYLAAIMNERDIKEALAWGAKGAGCCIGKEGAMDSIPLRDEVG